MNEYLTLYFLIEVPNLLKCSHQWKLYRVLAYLNVSYRLCCLILLILFNFGMEAEYLMWHTVF